MTNDLWRWADPDGQQRNVRLDELRAALAGGHIAPNTPVWRSGWTAWQAAHEVPELQSSALSAANGVVPNIPPPPLAMVAMQHEFEAKAVGSFSQPPPEAGGGAAPAPPHYVPMPVRASSVPPAPGQSGAGPRIASSLPTKLGLPPPPELLAIAEAQKARAARASKGGGASRDPMVEELSGSILLDDDRASSAGVDGRAPRPVLGPDGLPPPTDPVNHGSLAPGDEDRGTFPPRGLQLSAILDDLKELRAGRSPKNKLRLGVLAFIALMLMILLLALVVSAIGGKPSEGSSEGASSAKPATAGASTAPSLSPTASAPAVVASAPKEDPTPASTDAALGDCAIAGDAHVVAPHAFIQSGVEAVAVPGAIALGFAIDPRNGIALAVDPTSIATTTTAKARALGGDARRMSPVLEKGKLTLVPDVDKKTDTLQVRRVVGTSPAIDVGVADNAIVWAPHGLSTYAKLFPLEGEGAVEALRAVPLATTKGIALAFRRGNAIFVGVAKGDAALTAAGPLAHMPGLGQVGSPSIASTGDVIVVAWSDRATAQDPWQVRWTKVVPGAAPVAPKQLVAEGGVGTQAMSPSLAGLGSGRFVIAWSEGTPSHQVRAQSLTAEGSRLGPAVSVSGTGLNAGQPQVAVGSDGRGVVAFLAAKGKTYEVQAVPISCAAK